VTRLIGKNLITFGEVDSTNNYIKLNADKLSHGTIVTAVRQKHGRGRGNRSWESEDGNLYFSFILKNRIRYEDIFSVLINTSVSVVQVLQRLGIHSKIKYPNDILFDFKKICGILIETCGNNKIESIVVGVGINVNQVDFAALNQKATSIKQINNSSYNVDEIIQTFIEIYNINELTATEDMFTLYKEFSYVIGKQIRYNNVAYLISDIDKNGDLVLLNEGDVTRISLNEISLEELYNETNN